MVMNEMVMIKCYKLSRDCVNKLMMHFVHKCGYLIFFYQIKL